MCNDLMCTQKLTRNQLSLAHNAEVQTDVPCAVYLQLNPRPPLIVNTVYACNVQCHSSFCLDLELESGGKKWPDDSSTCPVHPNKMFLCLVVCVCAVVCMLKFVLHLCWMYQLSYTILVHFCSSVFIGRPSPAGCAQLYVRAVQHIYAVHLQLSPRPPLIVNTMGWMKGKKPCYLNCR